MDTGGCSITQSSGDLSGLVYELAISDLAECGVIERNGFLSVRVWFPAARGVLTSSDQEVIIMCKPPRVPLPVTSSQPPDIREDEGLKVQGEIDEEKLRYEVALYRQAEDGHEAGDVRGVVSLGALLQLRVSVVTEDTEDGGWTSLALLSLVLSPSPSEPRASGHVSLVTGGCRAEEFREVVPRQPWAEPGRPEVRVNMEAVMLDASRGRESRVWIHVTTRACRTESACRVSHTMYCSNLYSESRCPLLYFSLDRTDEYLINSSLFRLNVMGTDPDMREASRMTTTWVWGRC